MDVSSFVQRVNGKFDELTRAQQKAVSYMVDNWQECTFMSAQEIGDAAGVSETIIIRLAMFLGYSGYSELKADLQRSIRNQLKVKRAESVEPASTVDDLINIALRRSAQNVERVLDLNSVDVLVRAAKEILRAKRILVFGMRASSTPARSLASNLQLVLPDTRYASVEAGSMVDAMRCVGPRDLVITFALHTYSVFTEQVAEMTREMGCRHLTITDSYLSPTGRKSDIALRVSSKSTWFGHSNAGTMALLDVLLSLLLWLEPDLFHDSLVQHEALMSRYALKWEGKNARD